VQEVQGFDVNSLPKIMAREADGKRASDQSSCRLQAGRCRSIAAFFQHELHPLAEHFAPNKSRRDSDCRTLDKAALALVGAIAVLALLWGLLNPQLDTAKRAPPRAAPPPCYSIGAWAAPGCRREPGQAN